MKPQYADGFKYNPKPCTDYIKKDQSHLATMLNKLKIEADNGRIDNEWAENFILEMYFRIKQKLPVSPKQQAKIEEMFERY